MTHNSKKGFTLIELIITISILAVLVAIVVVALNPSEQLKRSRDTKRVSDLDTLKTALNLYLAQATGTINLTAASTKNTGCVGVGAVTFYQNTSYVTSSMGIMGGTNFTANSPSIGQSVATSTPTLVATSWMPALLGVTPGGAPIAILPLDPTNGTGNSTTTYYGYGCRDSNNTYEFTARLESDYFMNSLDLDGTDGGNSSSTYEGGTDLTIVGGGF